MSLVDLVVDDLRCLEHAEVSLHAGLNLIWGGNGSGKTSLLEAIFLLGRGRSFRTRNSERLIRHGREKLVVFGRTDGSAQWTLGVQVSRAGGTVARLNGAAAGALTDLSPAFPVQVIEPGVHRLIEESGHRRRRWLDWGVFHVEPQFGERWMRYTRAVKQRNAALRSDPDQAAAWDPELVRLGEGIAESRRSFLSALQPYWKNTLNELGGEDAELYYLRGWSQDASLKEALLAAKLRDEARHITHAGPHRADVAVRVRGKPAREVLSRGQQKLVSVAMNLAQLQLLKEATHTTPTLLLDDPAAELDSEHLARFIELVNQLGSQLIVTSLTPDFRLFGNPDRVFHVEHGKVHSSTPR